ncbi:DUF4123 domain-containing protein [Vibrio sp. SCSIO 43135]|uniref:DUF4123 domain-containing protein n=1 Tax=Vibrio sp. SCSIO 43135 TaxID=2819096 RepID=UPI002074E323|nr:DUF4123 domain-containing protein [Vibrio sp. SCSIO 43135]USD40072.1 DUF4123 domain-containing protein [Vibrio sp. SCSIO 43135]
MLGTWLNDNAASKYWLVDANTYNTAIKKNDGFAFDEAIPLFKGALFASVQSLSPWLIPYDDEVSQLPEELVSLGIGLASEENPQAVSLHLQSLLIASLDGVETMFRFYDRTVLTKMLATMEQSEINTLLGCISSVAVVEDDRLIVYENNSQHEYVFTPDTWWKIKPHHLAPLYDVASHVHSIERRCWELIPNLLAMLTDVHQTISFAVHKGITRTGSPEEAEKYALIAIADESGTHLSELSQPFHLTFDELKALETIKENQA